jgi:hypothetical protein
VVFIRSPGPPNLGDISCHGARHKTMSKSESYLKAQTQSTRLKKVEVSSYYLNNGCGTVFNATTVNIFALYSSTLFSEAGASNTTALLAWFGLASSTLYSHGMLSGQPTLSDAGLCCSSPFQTCARLDLLRANVSIFRLVVMDTLV